MLTCIQWDELGIEREEDAESDAPKRLSVLIIVGFAGTKNKRCIRVVIDPMQDILEERLAVRAVRGFRGRVVGPGGGNGRRLPIRQGVDAKGAKTTQRQTEKAGRCGS
jgi:hypothetical protein